MTNQIVPASPCARGCAWDPAMEGEAARPKPATHGTLCTGCYFRIIGALALVPDLMANMRAQLFTLGAADYSERVSGGGAEAPAPLNLAPLDASDALFAKLWQWCEVFADELHVDPPEVPSWANQREVQGSKPVSVEAAHLYTSWLCNWLTDRLEQIAATTSAAAFHDDLIDGHEDARGIHSLCATYGIEPRPVRAADKRECPICGQLEVFVKPPDRLDPDIAIICGRCEHVIPPASYAKYADLLRAVANG